MKRIMILIGIVGIVMVLAVSPLMVFEFAFASQIMGTPLHTDPGAHERIMSSPRPERFRFSRALPRSIDLEVEWRPIGDPDFHRGITGIFISRQGTLRVVDIHPRAMRGMRLWRSDNNGKNWKVERETGNADRDRVWLTGSQEKGEVLFSPFHMGTRPFRIWPLEVEELLKTEFRGLYEQRAHMSSAHQVFLAVDPNNPEIMLFCTVQGTGAPQGRPQTFVRLFVTIDGGERWTEINPTKQGAWACGTDSVRVGGLAVKKEANTIRIFIGQMGGGPRMVQMATISLPKLEKVLIAEE